MSRFSRTVLAYHGCLAPLANKLLTGELPPSEWPRSENVWDWLGHGIYFWEYAPERALRWAREKTQRYGGVPDIIGVMIDLDGCLDLTDVANTEQLACTYGALEAEYRVVGETLPLNRGGDPDRKRRELDCLVINSFFREAAHLGYQSVRAFFQEGNEAYPGAMVHRESHVQIAVRDPACILGVFRPNLWL